MLNHDNLPVLSFDIIARIIQISKPSVVKQLSLVSKLCREEALLYFELTHKFEECCSYDACYIRIKKRRMFYNTSTRYKCVCDEKPNEWQIQLCSKLSNAWHWAYCWIMKGHVDVLIESGMYLNYPELILKLAREGLFEENKGKIKELLALSKADVDFNVCNQYGHTALMSVVSRTKCLSDDFKKFISLFPIMDDVCQAERGVLSYVHNYEIFKYLADLGAKITLDLPLALLRHVRNESDVNADEIVKYFQSFEDFDINKLPEFYREPTVLFDVNNVEEARILVNAGVDVTKVNKKGQTALRYFQSKTPGAYDHKPKVIEYLKQVY